jgi:hypothetical protein
MKIRNFVIPGIVIVFAAAAGMQIFWVSPEGRSEKRRVRAQVEKIKTKKYLEENARSEIDFLAKKYDLDVLQDQLDKNKAQRSKNLKR